MSAVDQAQVTTPPTRTATTTMRAVVRERYGPPERLEVREVAVPTPTAEEVLVRVRAASLNFGDWYGLAGRPYVTRVTTGVRRPKEARLGWDFAGTVEAVGASVDHVRPGDEVYGERTGALAEAVCVRSAVVAKPPSLSFEEAAAVPTAALTALQGLRDKGRLVAGQHVLVNGASGGVGTFAVQIAKALGAEVTAVCSTHNVEQARALGADRVVDYTREDFTRGDARYDLLLDVAGSRSWSDCTRVLDPSGTMVIVGGPKDNRWLGPIAHVAGVRLAALRGSRRVVFFVARPSREDLAFVRELIEDAKVRPVIDRRYALGEIRDAMRYLGEGHARGKIVVSIREPSAGGRRARAPTG